MTAVRPAHLMRWSDETVCESGCAPPGRCIYYYFNPTVPWSQGT